MSVNANNNADEASLRQAIQGNDLLRARDLVYHHSVNVEATDDYGRNALHWACCYGNVDMIQYLVHDCRANVEAINHAQSTALHIAARYGHFHAVRFLVETTACHAHITSARNKWGYTPLHMACRYGHARVVQYLIKVTAASDTHDGTILALLHGASGRRHHVSTRSSIAVLLVLVASIGSVA